ncbi:hypothetical protein LY90DRAFT_678022 [Neocallimastix californiae]|uniref:Uncharacterized protein n=1 Tax=Neocallimastix californiae TaxID=1754190 RepID=A0A1Y1ZJ03_9FUNG|nr:hypothetical protein LY90DRAFT_678022 [Neocallimastix californiae]|eukprot:ORY10221.1 hypothetical protein LY90DRAFT_678022 [Neocallimastix californiae]
MKNRIKKIEGNSENYLLEKENFNTIEKENHNILNIINEKINENSINYKKIKNLNKKNNSNNKIFTEGIVAKINTKEILKNRAFLTETDSKHHNSTINYNAVKEESEKKITMITESEQFFEKNKIQNTVFIDNNSDTEIKIENQISTTDDNNMSIEKEILVEEINEQGKDSEENDNPMEIKLENDNDDDDSYISNNNIEKEITTEIINSMKKNNSESVQLSPETEILADIESDSESNKNTTKEYNIDDRDYLNEYKSHTTEYINNNRDLTNDDKGNSNKNSTISSYEYLSEGDDIHYNDKSQEKKVSTIIKIPITKEEIIEEKNEYETIYDDENIQFLNIFLNKDKNHPDELTISIDSGVNTTTIDSSINATAPTTTLIDTTKKSDKIPKKYKELSRFRFFSKSETLRNYVLRKIHLYKQKSLVMLRTTKTTRNDTHSSLDNSFSSSSSSSATLNMISNSNESTSPASSSSSITLSPQSPMVSVSQPLLISNERKTETKRKNISENLKFLSKVINKYQVANFIAGQRYGTYVGNKYYRTFLHHQPKSPKKDFQDYLKEYEEERFETNPYIQKYYEDLEDEEDSEDNDEEEEEEDDDDDDNDENDEYKNENSEEKISKRKYIRNKLNEKAITFNNNIFINQENKNEYQDIPLLENSPTQKKKHKRKENKKKRNLKYYQQCYDEERNSRNIYIQNDYPKESFKKKKRSSYDQNKLNRLIFMEMQKRKKERQSHLREQFGKQFFNENEKQDYQTANEYDEIYEMKQLNSTQQQQIEDQSNNTNNSLKPLQQKEIEKALVVDIKDEENEKENNGYDEEKQNLLNYIPKTLKKSVSFNLKDNYYSGNSPYHVPNQGINPKNLKSCLSKQSENYDTKLTMASNGGNNKKKDPLAPNTNHDIIASAIINENSPEVNSYINDNFGNFFSGYAYNNFYFFNGKNYHLMSMFNPKIFYREYFSFDSTIKPNNNQSFENLQKYFKKINLFRSIITTLYGIYELYENLTDSNIKKFGAVPFIIISFVFLWVDLFIALIKAFPKNIWFLWNVKDWDPIKNTWTVWSLVADHNTILDVLPVMINVIMKVYHFRLSQLISSSEVGSIFNDNSIPSLNIYDLNQVSLILFLISLYSSLILYAIRIDMAILSRSNSFGLAAVVIVKVILMIIDITTNLILLYEYLVTLGTEIFTFNSITLILFSILLFSFIVTLCTNVVVNLPLHYFFLRMGIKIRLDNLFVEYEEQFREYQYKTQSLNIYNNKIDKLSEETFTNIFNSDLYRESIGESSTSHLLPKHDKEEKEEDQDVKVNNMINFDIFNTYSKPNTNDNNNSNGNDGSNVKDINMTNKISTLLKDISPSKNQLQPQKHQKNKQQEQIQIDQYININIIGINFSLPINNNNLINNASLPSSSSKPPASNLPQPIMSKEILNSISLSASSFLTKNYDEKETYKYGNIDEIENSSKSINYENPNIIFKENLDAQRSIQNSNTNLKNKDAITVLDNIGSSISINDKKNNSKNQQYIVNVHKHTDDFTKENLELKEEDINEGIYKYYPKTIGDIENKIVQLQHIHFKHIIQVALKKVLNRIWDWNPVTSILKNGATLQEAGLIPESAFFEWNGSSGFKFHWLLWFNIFLNYLSGATLPIIYWIYVILYNVSSRKGRYVSYA